MSDINWKGGGGGGSGYVIPTYPFDVLAISKAGTTFTISVAPGTVNQLIPSNMVSPVVGTVTAMSYLVVTAATDGKQINNLSLAIEYTQPPAISSTPDLAPLEFKLLIALILPNGSWAQVWHGNTSATIYQAMLTNVTTPIPGQSLYRFWYSWMITTATANMY